MISHKNERLLELVKFQEYFEYTKWSGNQHVQNGYQQSSISTTALHFLDYDL